MSTIIISPVVCQDPRFDAGRQLVQKGLANEGGIDIFATLLEESRNKYGDSHIESAPAYYEYGNALLRGAMKQQQQQQEEEGEAEQEQENLSSKRQAVAAAAEQRQQQQQQQEKDDKKPAAKKEQSNGSTTQQQKQQELSNGEKLNIDSSEPEKDQDDNDDTIKVQDDNNDKNDEEEEDDNKDGDFTLALELMENAYSIMDEYCSTKDNNNNNNNNEMKYSTWVKEQLPRVLLGIGDALSAISRHADAADAYSRGLDLRQAILNDCSKNNNNNAPPTLQQLQASRKVCEATILVAEELLACPPNDDVITTETKSLIVKASERIEYVRGYYDKARDALQETVFLMGSLAAKGINVESEKQDVCFLATLVMGVGTTLETIKEEGEAIQEPTAKKQKTI